MTKNGIFMIQKMKKMVFLSLRRRKREIPIQYMNQFLKFLKAVIHFINPGWVKIEKLIHKPFPIKIVSNVEKKMINIFR